MNPWTDELIRHLRICMRCVGERIARVPNRCRKAQELIKETLKERHGDK